MPLTDIAVRQARPRDRAYKLTDGRGLTLLVQPTGAKWWRYRYRWNRLEQMLSLGTYPDVTLGEARKRRDLAREKLKQGIDPGTERRLANAPSERTFESVARHYLGQLEKKVRAKKRSNNTVGWLDENIQRWISTRPRGTTQPEVRS